MRFGQIGPSSFLRFSVALGMRVFRNDLNVLSMCWYVLSMSRYVPSMYCSSQQLAYFAEFGTIRNLRFGDLSCVEEVNSIAQGRNRAANASLIIYVKRPLFPRVYPEFQVTANRNMNLCLRRLFLP